MDPILLTIDEALKRKGLSDAAASKLAVGHPSLIKNLRMPRDGEKRYNLPALMKLAEVLDLEFYFGPPRDTGPVEPIVLAGSDFAQVPVHKATLAAGGGADNHTEELAGYLAYRRSWLKRVGVAASAAVLARATGESMAPTIHDGDMLLIDRAKADPPAARRSAKDTRPSPIYAILDVDTGARVKRLELAAPGTLALLSDNPSFAPEFRPVYSVKIIGKVVWWGHTSKE